MSCGGGAICAAAVRRTQAPVFARIGPAAAGKADTPSLRAIAAPAVPDAGGRARAFAIWDVPMPMAVVGGGTDRAGNPAV